MIEENNDNFLAGGDALVYLAGPIYQKCPTIFLGGHPIKYVRILEPIFQAPSPLSKHRYAFRVNVTVVGFK